MQKKNDGCHTRTDIEFAQNIANVHLGGLFGDRQRYGDLLIRQAVGQFVQHVQFAPGQLVKGIAGVTARSAFPQILLNALAENIFPGGSGTQLRQQSFGIAVF